MSVTFYSLRFVNYRLWFFGALVSNVGTWMQRVGQDWLILTKLTDHDALAVGIGTALQFAPAVVLSVPAGLLADRLDRRKLLLATQMAMAVLTLTLGVLTVTDAIQLWHVYVLAFALGCVSAVDGPVRQTFVTDMVPQQNIANAVGLNSTSFNMARMVGPALGGVLIVALGTGWLFVANAATFAATIVALRLMRPGEMYSTVRLPRGKGQIRAGLAYVARRSDIKVLLVVLGVVSTFTLNFQMTIALMSTVEFGKGAGEYGLAGSVLALGTLAGALLATRRRTPRVRIVVAAAAGLAASAALMAVAPNYPVFVITCIPAGFCALTMLTAANATVQVSTEPAMRGRVMAIYMMVLLGATPIGSTIVGWIGREYGPRAALGIGAASAALVAIGATIWVMRHWRIEFRYSWQTRPHLQILNPEVEADVVRAQESAIEQAK